MSSVKVIVDGKIAGKKVMVFSKSSCPYCTKAKRVFKNHMGSNLSQSDYEVMEIEKHPKCSEIQNYLSSITGARSVPRVFINGKCIGGGDETAQLDKNGKLIDLLNASRKL